MLVLTVTGVASRTAAVPSGKTATVRKPANALYEQGYLGDSMPLADFVTPDLLPACRALERGDLATARRQFGAELRVRPNNLAALAGYLQSLDQDRERLLASLEQRAGQTQSPTEAFKHGLLAYYVMEDQMLGRSKPIVKPAAPRPAAKKPDPNAARRVKPRPAPPTPEQRRALAEMELRESLTKLRKTAFSKLKYSWQKSREPVAGLALISTFPHASGPGTMRATSEELLNRLGGSKMYAAYQTAKARRWQGNLPPLPPTPALSREKMMMLRWAVGYLQSSYGRRTGTTRKGPPGTPLTVTPLTPEQERATAYLRKWKQELRSRMEQGTKG